MTQAGLGPMSITSRCLRPRQCAALLLSLLIASFVARAEELPPAPKGYFNDYAGVISEAKQHELNERLAKFDKDTGYTKHRSRSHRAVIRVYDAIGNVIETDEAARSHADRCRMHRPCGFQPKLPS
jgi:hypothetical protein